MTPSKALSAALIAALLAGCSGMPKLSWPWSKGPPPAPVPVQELTAESSSGTTLLQFWEENVLVLDLTSAPGHGSVTLKPAFDRGWPYRIAVRTIPGRFATLEARGSQRSIVPLTVEGAKPVDLAIPPSVYPAGTPQLELVW